ncbi:PAS domain S-box-containing protein [Flavobacterium sp. PL11]|uniref:PAS domain S-box protein n=1 Tax=Flavobacterium sp. PL11 TaxID=3071717 RepID=UPI002E0C4873|nr:PAS domain S-box-containing protein [Flavobacterium sp. PL11]
MKTLPQPDNESQRIEKLKEYSILDTLAEKEYDSITKLASYICETPIALVSLIDENRQWFKSKIGLDISETSRDLSFCQYTIMGDAIYEVTDTRENDLFHDHPLVTAGPEVRFYAGAPLRTKEGLNMGSLCVIDTKPRILNENQKKALTILADQVVTLLKYRTKQETLRKSQLELQNFIDLSQDLVCIANLNGFFLKVNPAFSNVLGYDTDELEGFHFTDFVHTDDIASSYKVAAKLAAGEVTLSFENRFRCKNGDYITLSWNTSPDPITGNLYSIARDITKEKEAEEHLINTNNLLEESQNIAKIGSWKFDVKNNDLIWSNGQYAIFEMEKLPPNELYKAFRSRIHRDDIKKLNETNIIALKTGDNFKTNYRIVFPNKKIKYITEIGQPFKDEKGNVIEIKGVIQDVTEITIAEQEIILKSKEITDIKSALDESTIVSIIDKKGLITYTNDNFSTISKYRKDELIGKDQRSVLGLLDKESAKDILSTIFNGKVWKGELRNLAKDGSTYWEKTTIVPFLDQNNRPYQYISIGADITDQKNAEKKLIATLLRLEKTNKALDEFAYVVSHDLKAPLRAINNLSEWIVEDMPDMPKEVSSNFDLLRGRVLRMENLINGVLEYSRIGRIEIKKEEIDLKVMLNEIIDFIVPKTGFETVVGNNFPKIYSERILLEQIFSNLISNSVKYNNKIIGKIECIYEEFSTFHKFIIKDNGLGISQDYHEKVFKIFQTITARDIKESTGVGLSIVKKIIEEKGGTISIQSQEDQGCSFIFTILK